MRIEDAIKQKSFKSEHQKLMINLIYTSNWLRATHNLILKPFDISIQQYNILRILKGQYPKPTSINVLIERMLDRNSNASRLVDKLVAKNLVNRNVCPKDRRKVEVLLTPEGGKLLNEATAGIEQLIESTSFIKEKDAQQFNETLDAMRTIKIQN